MSMHLYCSSFYLHSVHWFVTLTKLASVLKLYRYFSDEKYSPELKFNEDQTSAFTKNWSFRPDFFKYLWLVLAWSQTSQMLYGSTVSWTFQIYAIEDWYHKDTMLNYCQTITAICGQLTISCIFTCHCSWKWQHTFTKLLATFFSKDNPYGEWPQHAQF